MCVLQSHTYTLHRDERTEADLGFRPVRLHVWSQNHTKRYWIASETRPDDPELKLENRHGTTFLKWRDKDDPVLANPTHPNSTPDDDSILEQLKRKAAQRSKRVHTVFESDAGSRSDDTTEFNLFTRWPEDFKGKELKTIGQTRLLRGCPHHIWEKFPDLKLSHLELLLPAFDRVVSNTIEKTPRSDVPSMAREPQTQVGKVFRIPQQEKTLKRYVATWKHLLTYLFRVASLPERVRLDEYGPPLTVEHLSMINETTAMLYSYKDDGEEEEDLDVDVRSEEIHQHRSHNDNDEDDEDDEEN